MLYSGCDQGFFKCSDGACLDSSKVCNGVANCAGADDEETCSCTVVSKTHIMNNVYLCM